MASNAATSAQRDQSASVERIDGCRRLPTYRCFNVEITGNIAHIQLKRGDELNTMVPEFWTSPRNHRSLCTAQK
jgi:hypothetical protein